MTRMLNTIGRGAARAALVGALPVLLGYLVSLVWALLLTVGDVAAIGSWAAPAGLWLLLPCLPIAWALAAWSLHLSRGVSLTGRVLSLVLWQALTPVVWAVGLAIWAGATSADAEAGGLALFAVPVGLAIWCACLTPAFIVVFARRLLADDPANGPAGRRRTRDEIDEDAEVEQHA